MEIKRFVETNNDLSKIGLITILMSNNKKTSASLLLFFKTTTPIKSYIEAWPESPMAEIKSSSRGR